MMSYVLTLDKMAERGQRERKKEGRDLKVKSKTYLWVERISDDKSIARLRQVEVAPGKRFTDQWICQLFL